VEMRITFIFQRWFYKNFGLITSYPQLIKL
jgi:hypothetical protein